MILSGVQRDGVVDDQLGTEGVEACDREAGHRVVAQLVDGKPDEHVGRAVRVEAGHGHQDPGEAHTLAADER